jgi:hypothetical protein
MLKSRSTGLKFHQSRRPLIRQFRIGQRLAGFVLACAGAASLASCSSVLSDIPSQMGGLPEGTPERQAAPPAYPAVHDMPPPRPTAVLTEEEKKKVEAELAAMRAEQARRAAARGQIE